MATGLALAGLTLALSACGPSDEELDLLIDQRAQAIVDAMPTVTPQVIPTPGCHGYSGTGPYSSTHCHGNAHLYSATHGNSGAGAHASAHANPGDLSPYSPAGNHTQYPYSATYGHAPARNRLPCNTSTGLAFGFHGGDQAQPGIGLVD